MTATRRLFFAALAACTALAAPSAQAKTHKPDLSKVPVLKTIPPELVAAFPVLKQKRAALSKVPGYVLRSFAEGPVARTYKTDPRQIRAVNGMKGSPWWVAPGAKGLCVMISAGSTCMATADVLTRGLLLLRMPPPAPGERPDLSKSGQATTFEGLAPAGWTSVLVTLASGATATIPITASGAYRDDVAGPFTTAQLIKDGADPVTLYGPPPQP